MNEIIKQRVEMIRRGEVPGGYKKTKAGVLPPEWKACQICECLERVEKPVAVEPDKQYTQIGIRSHGKGLFYKDPVCGKALGNKQVFWIEPDCFVLNIVFAWEQAIGKTTQNEVGMIGSHRFPMYRPIGNKISVDYLISYFLTKRGTDILEAASPGGAGRNRTLGQDRFLKSKIVLPSYAEQQKIAEILTTCNKAIELKGKMNAEKQQQKKNLMQQLLTGKIRLNGFTGKWRVLEMGLISKKQKMKNHDFRYKLVLSNSAQQGIIPQNEHFDKDIANAENIDGYYVVHNGYFVYNPRISVTAPCGPINVNETGYTGIMSPLYTVFSVEDTRVDNLFLKHYFHSTVWFRYMKSVANYGARHDRMSITDDDFFGCQYHFRLLMNKGKSQVFFPALIAKLKYCRKIWNRNSKGKRL